MSDLHTIKQQLRRVIRQRKQQYPTEQREAWSKEIEQRLLQHPRLQSAHVVMLYYALDDEVDTRRLVDTLLKEGKTVILPKCVDKECSSSISTTSRQRSATSLATQNSLRALPMLIGPQRMRISTSWPTKTTANRRSSPYSATTIRKLSSTIQ